MFCKHCGNQLDDSAKFCGRCGNPTTEAPAQSAAPVAPVQPITPPAYVYPTQPANPPKKVSAGAIISLIFSLSPVFVVVGSLLSDAGLGLIMAIAGVLMFVPGLLVTLITFIRGFKRYKQTRMKPDFILRNVSFALMYIPVVLIILGLILLNPLMYGYASNLYDSGDYIAAYNTYELLDDYKDSSNQAEKALLRALEGNWKDPDYPDTGFIRITITGDQFASVILLDGEVYNDPDLMVYGSVEVNGNKVRLVSTSGELYLAFNYSVENNQLKMVDNTGNLWIKYE